MTGILSHLRIVTEDLNDLGAGWALIGALAVSVHTEPRSTRDIDVTVVAPELQDQERLVNDLERRGYRNMQLLMHMLPTQKLGVRFEIRDSGSLPLALDLLFNSSGIEGEIVANAVKIEVFPQLFIPVACRGHLIAMKVLSQNDSDRIRDKADLWSLLNGAAAADIVLAEEAVNLMTRRGFNRSKDLLKDLEKALAGL